jgi:pilus assembly protein CpaE
MFFGFAQDEASALVLREALAGCLPQNAQIHVTGYRAALARLGRMPTPEVILIDLSGEDQPINALGALAERVEPGSTVLAIGTHQTVSFYRTVTKGLGVREYLAKPLRREMVAQIFVPIIADRRRPPAVPRGGRMTTFFGARGGVGTTTIATSLGWLIGTRLHRHTVILDTDLYAGTVALTCNLTATTGLMTALETPERLDTLLVERSVRPFAERVDILAGQEALQRKASYNPGNAAPLIRALRARYNFLIVDAGARLEPFARDVLSLTPQLVIVMEPSPVSIRNMTRLLTLPNDPLQAPRPMLVLNHAGIPGGMAIPAMEEAMGARFAAVIPDLPRIVPKNTQLGIQPATLRGPYRQAITELAAALDITAPGEAT